MLKFYLQIAKKYTRQLSKTIKFFFFELSESVDFLNTFEFFQNFLAFLTINFSQKNLRL